MFQSIYHPNLVNFISSTEENGQYFLILEFCEGGDLETFITKQLDCDTLNVKITNFFAMQWGLIKLCFLLFKNCSGRSEIFALNWHNSQRFEAEKHTYIPQIFGWKTSGR